MALSDCDAPSADAQTYNPAVTTTARGVNIIATDLKTGTNSVTLTGLSASQVMVFSKPLAADSNGLLLYDAASYWPDDSGTVPVPSPVPGQTWDNTLSLYGNNGGSDVLLFTAVMDTNYYATSAAAFAQLAAQMPVAFTGYTTYKVVGKIDTNPSDNRGGLSVLVEARSAGWSSTLPTPTSPASGGGKTVTAVASEALAAGDFVNLWNNSGALNVRKASAADTTKPADGYVLAAIASGWTATVYLPGTVNDQQSGLTLGTRYYLSPTTAGAITATMPTTAGQLVQSIGVAVSVTAVTVEPDSSSVDSAALDAAFGSTQGDILYRNATVWTALGPGTSGQVLQTNGAAANPSWVTPTGGSVGSGGLVLLEQHTASSSASLDFTTWYSTNYDEYWIEFVNLIPATNGAKAYIRLSTDGGATYDSSAIYDYGASVSGSSAFTAAVGLEGVGQFNVFDGQSNSTTESLTGSAKLYSPASTALYKQFRWDLGARSTDTHHYLASGSGRYKSTTAVNAFQVIYSTGAVASGIVRVYGVSK